MIYVILGTRAQLVKMAPIIRIMEAKNWPLKLIHTGQHRESMVELCQDFNIKTTWKELYHQEQEVNTIIQAILWLLALGVKIFFKPPAIFKDSCPDQDIILVHGDTFSTVLGAIIGKRLGIKVAHIESGLRSFSLINPFPEEINRLLTFHLSNVAFCPGRWAVNNLSAYPKLTKINTHHNTILDTLRLALNNSCADGIAKIPDTEYGIVSLHRFENIFFNRRFRLIINQLLEVSTQYHLIFVLHPATRKRLMKTGLMHKLTNTSNIELRDRTGYFDFVKLMASSHFVITDGGSNQEELFYLGIPTFLMRKATERKEGLGQNICLGKYSAKNLDAFIKRIKADDFRDNQPRLPSTSPAEIICHEISFAAK